MKLVKRLFRSEPGRYCIDATLTFVDAKKRKLCDAFQNSTVPPAKELKATHVIQIVLVVFLKSMNLMFKN